MHILMMTKAHQGIHRLIPPFHMHYLTSFYRQGPAPVVVKSKQISRRACAQALMEAP